MLSVRCRLAISLGVALAFHAVVASSYVIAQQDNPARDGLDDHLARLVTEIRADVPDLEGYEPFIVLPVLHDERGYRVRSSDLLERRLTSALAAQGIRVIDPAARQRILDELENCYTDEAPFCRAADVVGRFQTAGGIMEGSVLPIRGGVELRVKVVVAAVVSELSPGEILGTWTVVVPPPAMDAERDLVPALGAVSYGLPVEPGDSLAPDAYGELRVDVRTEDGTRAWVQIDGRVVVPAPVTTTTTAGRHLLTVTAVGHRPFSDYVHVPPGGIVNRDIQLERGVGTVVITSNAEDATIYLDERRVGFTPWRGEDIEAGQHQITVERAGFDPYSKRFTLEHQEERHIYAALGEHPGDIVVTCVHDKVRVYLDHDRGGPAGMCSTGQPLTLTNISAGEHKMWGVRGDDRSRTTIVIVRGGEAVPVRLALRLGPEVEDDGDQQREERVGPRRHRGVYFSVGAIGGEAEWREQLDGETTVTYSVEGNGVRLGASIYNNGWELGFGIDVVFFEKFEGFEGSNQYYEFFMDVNYHFLPNASVQPFVGGRLGMNTLTFKDVDGFEGDLKGWSLDVGGQAGVNIRLSRKASLEVGATYTYTGYRDLFEEGDGLSSPAGMISIEDWTFASGFLMLKVGSGGG